MKWSEVSFLRKQESRLLWHVPVELDSKWGLGHMESADVLDSRFRTSPTPPPLTRPGLRHCLSQAGFSRRGRGGRGIWAPLYVPTTKVGIQFFPGFLLTEE
jgi:hypothetical protein